MQRYLMPLWATLLLACGHGAVRAPAPGIPVSARRVERAPAPEDAPAAEEALARPAPVSPRGSRGAAAFGDFVRSREPQLQYCYQEARVANPGLAGSATMSVAFSEAGDVTSVTITRRAWSGGDGADVEACVVAKVRAWKFPPTDEKPRPQSFSLIFTQ
jgi:hypothetical protein